MKAQCSNCFHWGEEDQQNSYGVLFSRCYRFPPVVIPRHIVDDEVNDSEQELLGRRFLWFDFPFVSEYAKCGEYKSKPT